MATRDEFGGVVTLYNRYRSEGNDCWQRTVLRGVALLDRQGEAVRLSGAASSSARRMGAVSVGDLTVVIPLGVRGNYLTPMGWRLAEGRSDCWTLQAGDIIVRGDCELEMTGDSTELMDAVESFATINMVADYTSDRLLAHWEVSAR